jgi:hypothetical protein
LEEKILAKTKKSCAGCSDQELYQIDAARAKELLGSFRSAKEMGCATSFWKRTPYCESAHMIEIGMDGDKYSSDAQ